MIVDSSALLAIAFAEPDAPLYAIALRGGRVARMSVVNWVEAAIRVESRGGPAAIAEFEELVDRSRINIEPVTEEQGRTARRAYASFGKGRHRAGLNLGDCFAYALAKATGEPLLYKGDDFGHTDVPAAL